MWYCNSDSKKWCFSYYRVSRSEVNLGFHYSNPRRPSTSLRDLGILMNQFSKEFYLMNAWRLCLYPSIASLQLYILAFTGCYFVVLSINVHRYFGFWKPYNHSHIFNHLKISNQLCDMIMFSCKARLSCTMLTYQKLVVVKLIMTFLIYLYVFLMHFISPICSVATGDKLFFISASTIQLMICFESML